MTPGNLPPRRLVRYALELEIDPEHAVFQKVKAFIYAAFPEETAGRLWGTFIELATNIYRYAYGSVSDSGSVIWVRFFDAPDKIMMVLEDRGKPVTEEDRQRMLKAMAPRSWEQETPEFTVGDGLLLAQGGVDEMTLPSWDEIRQVNAVSVTVLKRPAPMTPEDIRETTERA